MRGDVLVLRGDLTPDAVPKLRAAFRGPAAPRRIDLSAVTWVSSAALAELVMVAHRAGTDRITLANPQPLVQRTLRILEMDRLFDVRVDQPRAPGSTG